MQKGIDKILKKIGEEATEVVIAAKGGMRDEIVYETADLIFHLLVMLGYHDIPPSAVYDELQRRFGISGLAEKAARILTPRLLTPLIHLLIDKVARCVIVRNSQIFPLC